MGQLLLELPAVAVETNSSIAKHKLRVMNEMGGVIVHLVVMSKGDL
jgi:hypothetical protein